MLMKLVYYLQAMTTSRRLLVKVFLGWGPSYSGTSSGDLSEVEHHSWWALFGYIRLGWNCSTRTNALAYLPLGSATQKKVWQHCELRRKIWMRRKKYKTFLKVVKSQTWSQGIIYTSYFRDRICSRVRFRLASQVKNSQIINQVLHWCDLKWHSEPHSQNFFQNLWMDQIS